MSDYNLEHPDVSAAQRTGYARGREPKVAAFCSECGEPIFVGEIFLRISHFGCICHDCVDANWREDEDE